MTKITWPESHVNTVECRYNAVQFSTILHTALRKQRQKVNQILESPPPPPPPPQYLALTGELRGVYCENFEDDLPRYNDTALFWLNVWYCLWQNEQMSYCYTGTTKLLLTPGSCVSNYRQFDCRSNSSLPAQAEHVKDHIYSEAITVW